MTVADRIKERRIYLNLSQEELAKKMGYSSKSAVSRTENAGDKIGSNRIAAFAKALGVTVPDLMGWTEEEENNKPQAPEYSSDIMEIIRLYSGLNDAQKKSVMSLLHSFYA